MEKRVKVALMLRDLSKNSQKDDIYLYAEVIKITGNTCTCLVRDMEITDINLCATENNEIDKLVITPKVNSTVLLGSIHGDLNHLVVIKVDNVEKISYKHNKLEIDINGTTGKVDIKNDKTSLTSLFSSIADIISKLTVSTPSGPSGTPLPPTIKAIEQFKIDFKNLLK